MTDATADERVLASSKALSKILVCIYVREASRREKILSLSLSLTRPRHGVACLRQGPSRLSKNPALTGWHWNYPVPRARRPRTIPTAARAPGSIPIPAKQLSARRLSAMTPKAAKRTTKRRPARRKENQKPKSAAAKKPPTKAKTKRRLQSLRRRAERQDRTPKLTRRDEHSSLAKSLGVRSLDLFRSFCPHESF